jgi:protein-L-isoaspartate(D-aspartate) O-methyltransferase
MIPGVHQSRVERALKAVPREFFIPAGQRSHAAEDRALPIGFAQTISQPSLVAFMTEKLAPSERDHVLEIGTGSGYQTAILAELAERVFTIERVPELARAARTRLESLGYRNVDYRLGDGAHGWPEHSPFDAIMVSAAPEVLPLEWLRQIKPGGRMIAPVGSVAKDDQTLMLFEKDSDGAVRQSSLCAVRFVPLISPASPGM